WSGWRRAGPGRSALRQACPEASRFLRQAQDERLNARRAQGERINSEHAELVEARQDSLKGQRVPPAVSVKLISRCPPPSPLQTRLSSCKSTSSSTAEKDSRMKGRWRFSSKACFQASRSVSSSRASRKDTRRGDFVMS